MQSFWQTVWFYFKVVLITLIGINVVLFVIANLSAVVEPGINLNFFRNYDRPSLLFVLLITSAISIFGWWLFWTVLTTLRQLRSARDRARTSRLEREVADMKTKAAMLQTKPGEL